MSENKARVRLWGLTELRAISTHIASDSYKTYSERLTGHGLIQTPQVISCMRCKCCKLIKNYLLMKRQKSSLLCWRAFFVGDVPWASLAGDLDAFEIFRGCITCPSTWYAHFLDIHLRSFALWPSQFLFRNSRPTACTLSKIASGFGHNIRLRSLVQAMYTGHARGTKWWTATLHYHNHHTQSRILM